MPVRLRNDDILVHSRQWPDPQKKFRQVHEWISISSDVIHVPTIIVNAIQDFPECVEYCKVETSAGRMEPEIHGLDHIDYGKLTKNQVKSAIAEARDWISDTVEREPKFWYTPWGASQPHLHEAANELGLTLIDTSSALTLEGPNGCIARLSQGEPTSAFDGREILYHWWSGGLRLLRFCRVMQAGSWNAAFEADPELFRG